MKERSFIVLIMATIVLLSNEMFAASAPTPLYPLPNARQMYYLHNPHAAFIHYGMNTYTNKEWGTGYESCSTFNPPKEVNTDQWARVLKECGFDRIVLTGKHHDGFCLWPSKANTVNPHTIAQSPYKNGQGDLYEQLSESCTKYEIDMGVYLSPWDAYEENVGGNYTSSTYNDFYVTQLNEVLGSYGRYNEELGRRELVEIWLDGATGSNNPPVYDFNRFVDVMRQHQPTAYIWIDALRAFQTCVSGDTCKVDGAWAMNEAGQAPDPCWNKMDTNGSNTDACKNKPNGEYFFLLEADVSIRNGWFYGDGGGLKSAVDLFKERYMKSIGRGIPLILNVPPDQTGEFTDEYIAVLQKYKEYLDTTFGTNLVPPSANASATEVRGNDATFGADKVMDNNYDTYWTMNDGSTTGSVILDFGADVRFDIVQFQEYIPLGQRVSGWKVDVKVNGNWQEFATGSTIGYKRIVQAKEVQASAVRLTITGSLAVPLINSLSVFRAHEDLIESDLPPVAGVDGQFVMDKEYITAKETDGTVSVKVKLEDRSEKEVSVYVATVPGTGVQGKVYQDKTATLTFPAGVNEQEFIVNLINNQNNEGGKDFYIQISNPLGGDVTIGEPSSIRVWVEDDENPMPERTVTISSEDNSKGSVKILVPETTETSITSSFPVMIEATPASGYKFVQWENALTNTVVSTEKCFTYESSSTINLIARFDEAYIVMTHTYTNNTGQQNRYLSKVTTTGTNTPTVFSASSTNDLPYTAFPSGSIGQYIESGACIDKRDNPIKVDYGTTSFNITFYGYTSSINGNATELNWTQQAVFIDWGKDGSFNESGDIYSKSSDDIGNSSSVCSQFISSSGYTRTITIPANQPAGKYRMRVVYHEPESNSDQWQNSIMTTSGEGKIRNGVSYDFEIEIVSSTVPSRTITVSANPSEGGTVSGGGTGEEAIAIRAVANEGYQFLNWTVNGNIVSYNANYSDFSEGNKEYVANFRLIPTYSVSVAVNDVIMGIATLNGGNSDIQTLEGTTVTLAATANEGYKFAGWRLNGSLVSNSNPYVATITTESEFVALFEEGGAEYFTNFGNSTRTDRSRNLSSFSFSDGTNSKTISVNQSANSGAAIYYDKTSEVVTLEPGKAISSTINWNGYWMHTFIFVDWDNNGEFTKDLASTNYKPTENSELIAFSFWSGVNGSSSDSQGYDHAGAYLTGDNRNVHSLKTFTIPVGKKPGSYRARLKIDWNNVDANSISSLGDAPCVVDFTLTIPGTITFSIGITAGEGGSATINGETTTIEVAEGEEVILIATPEVGYEFEGWYVGDTQISNESEYTTEATTNRIYEARFVVSSGMENNTNTTAKVYTSNGTIYINGYNGTAKIINMAGQIIKEINVDDSAQIELSRGIYSVIIDGKTIKVVI